MINKFSLILLKFVYFISIHSLFNLSLLDENEWNEKGTDTIYISEMHFTTVFIALNFLIRLDDHD